MKTETTEVINLTLTCANKTRLTCAGNATRKKDLGSKSSEKKPIFEDQDGLRTPQNNGRSDLLAKSVESKCGDDGTGLSRCCRDAMGGGAEARGEHLKEKHVSKVDT